MSAGAADGDHCPRCAAGFHCGVQDTSPCPCSSVSLSADLRARLRQRYNGCLCLACLRALSAHSDAAGAQSLRTTTLPTE